MSIKIAAIFLCYRIVFYFLPSLFLVFVHDSSLETPLPHILRHPFCKSAEYITMVPDRSSKQHLVGVPIVNFLFLVV